MRRAVVRTAAPDNQQDRLSEGMLKLTEPYKGPFGESFYVPLFDATPKFYGDDCGRNLYGSFSAESRRVGDDVDWRVHLGRGRTTVPEGDWLRREVEIR